MYNDLRVPVLTDSAVVALRRQSWRCLKTMSSKIVSLMQLLHHQFKPEPSYCFVCFECNPTVSFHDRSTLTWFCNFETLKYLKCDFFNVQGSL